MAGIAFKLLPQLVDHNAQVLALVAVGRPPNGALLRSDLLLGREGAILTFNRTEEAATGCLPLSISILKIEPNGELPRSVPAQTLWQNFRQGSEGARVADVRRWGGKVGAVEDVSECRFEAQLVMVVEDDSLRQPGVNV
jgi:hypothetical protein